MMNELWIKIKAWTKAILIGALLIYALLFIYNNSGEPVNFWWWFSHTHPTSVFFLTAGAFLAGIIFTILVRTSWKTWRQIRTMRERGRTGKLEREMADMKAKAAMLQTRPAATGSTDGVTVKVDNLGEGT
jgi:uncharacterized integral membrane protein